MRGRRPFIALLVTLALVGACSDGGSSDGTGANGTTGTSTSTSTKTSAACPYRDRARGQLPTVQVRPPGASAPATLTEERPVPCGTVLTVSGGGTAGVDFGTTTTATCQISQYQAGGNPATIGTRDPRTALFRMDDGRALCTIKEAGTRVPLCGDGILLVSDAMQVSAECEQGSAFGVIAYAGSLRAIFPDGEERAVSPGTGLLYSFDSGEVRDVTANFDQPVEELFAQQAVALGLQPLPQKFPLLVDAGDGFLTVTNVVWSGAPPVGLTYQWQGSCSSSEEDAMCTDIVGATDSTYAPTESDCPAVRVVVTAENDNGSNRTPSPPEAIDFIIDCSSTTSSSTSSATASPSG